MAYVEHYHPGDKITYTVGSTAVEAGNVVEATGDETVEPGGNESLVPVGIACYDAAVGAKVAVASEGVWDLTASGAISAGQRVVCAASGEVKADAGTGIVVGFAIEAIADTATGQIQLTL